MGLTSFEHTVWMAVCLASKRGKWYVPRSPAEYRTLAGLDRRGYLDGRYRRKRKQEYRLLGFWPRHLYQQENRR